MNPQDAEADFHLGLDFDLSGLSTDEPLDLNQFDFLDDIDSSDSPPRDSSSSGINKPYYAKRPHRKSRAGCKRCKKRKVKCDEARPSCKACTLRQETCEYPDTSSSPVVSNRQVSKPSINSSRDVPSHSPQRGSTQMIIAEPLFRPAQMADVTDLKLLWFYTAETYTSFSIETSRSPVTNSVLQVKIPEIAFQCPFLMDCLMALSALHLQELNQAVPVQRAASYRAKAFAGYRNAIETAGPSDYPALLACSLLMCALSSQTFRDPYNRTLYSPDWIAVWRGIGLIIEIISPASVQASGLAGLFYRPPINLDKSVQYIPNNLLFMITSISIGDPDYDHQKTYYELLKYLGSLYMELTEHGFSPAMDLRTIVFFSFTPRAFIQLAREHRPRALVIIAYYLCFVKMLSSSDGVWWMKGIADSEIELICEEVGGDLAPLLRIPRMVQNKTDCVEIANLIIDNHNWTPAEMDFYKKEKGPGYDPGLKLITNEGAELELTRGHWRFKTDATKLDWQEPNQYNPQVSSETTPYDPLMVTPNRDLCAFGSQASSLLTVSTPSSTASPMCSHTSPSEPVP